MGFDINDLLIKSRPEQEKALFMALVKCCKDMPTELVVGAAINVLITAIRQVARTKDAAEKQFNNTADFGRTVLLNHYDSVTGRVRTTMPFTQTLHAPHHVDTDIIHNTGNPHQPGLPFKDGL